MRYFLFCQLKKKLYLPRKKFINQNPIIMKKLFTIFAIVFAVVAVNAQNVIFSENFDNSGVPSGWINNDADGDNYNWENTLDILGEGYGHNGSAGCMYSQSYDNSYGALTPNNWLVTPQINLPNTNCSLRLYVTAQDASWAAEHWGVAVSTTGTNPSDFTMIYEETFSASKDQATWQEKNIALTGYSGNVYIAFRHFNCTDQYWFELDDVAVIANGTGIANVEETTFTVYPNPATTSIKVTGEGEAVISNILGQTVTSATVNGSEEINVSNLESGVYFITMNGVSKKFIKK